MENEKPTPALIELPEHLNTEVSETPTKSEQSVFIDVSDVPGYVEQVEKDESDRSESDVRDLGRYGLGKIEVKPSASGLRGPSSGYTEVSPGRFVPTELVRRSK